MESIQKTAKKLNKPKKISQNNKTLSIGQSIAIISVNINVIKLLFIINAHFLKTLSARWKLGSE